MTLTSIIIPVFNRELYLAETIESALAQTYPNTEIIVIDDGSTDGSRAIAEKFPVKVIPQANAGVAVARNVGITASAGELILPLDSDDLIDPHYLEETVPMMGEGIGIVATNMDYFGELRKMIRPSLPTSTRNGLPVCSLVRKEAIEQAGGYDSSVEFEDWDLWLKILKNGWKCAFLPQVLFHYRVLPQSRNSEADKDRERWVKQIQERHGFAP